MHTVQAGGGADNGSLSGAFEADDGGRSSFDAIYALYGRRVFNVIYGMVGHYDDAEDLTQETFLHGYQALDRFRGDSAVYTWLYRIAVNVCKGRFQYESRACRARMASLDEPAMGAEGAWQSEVPDDSSDPCRVLESHELQDVVRQAIQELPGEFRVPIVLREDQQLSCAEIATIMEIPAATVRTRLFRARGLLRVKLGPYMGT